MLCADAIQLPQTHTMDAYAWVPFHTEGIKKNIREKRFISLAILFYCLHWNGKCSNLLRFVIKCNRPKKKMQNVLWLCVSSNKWHKNGTESRKSLIIHKWNYLKMLSKNVEIGRAKTSINIDEVSFSFDILSIFIKQHISMRPSIGVFHLAYCEQ